MSVSWSVVARCRPPVSLIVEELGRDRALTPAEVSVAARQEAGPLRQAWQAYERHWARFCGAQVDPQFWRFDHPARWAGTPIVTDGTPLVIVGTGPSLADGLEDLRRCRSGVHVMTSPRGADALSDAGLDPDVVIIEHPTALDAQFSVQALPERPHPWRDRVALVAADSRTPWALLDGIPADRLVVLDPRPSWGLWPATAAAMALGSGASRVGLLGVDLGSTSGPDPRQQPLRDLLSLLAAWSPVPCVDLGACAAPKPGWSHGAMTSFAGDGPRQTLALARVPWTTREDRLRSAAAAWRQLGSLAETASAALAAAGGLRDDPRPDPPVARVVDGLARLMDAGSTPEIRAGVQDELGCGFLPRFWRTPPQGCSASRLWRPVALAAHELVQQHRTLGDRLRAEGLAP